MPHIYNVDIHDVEGNGVRVSVTGTVNGQRSAATVSRSDLPITDSQYQKGLTDKYSWPPRAKRAMADALVDAMMGKGEQVSSHPGLISIERE